jgi:hypothetical protein
MTTQMKDGVLQMGVILQSTRTGSKYSKYNRVGGDERNHENVRINCERAKDTNYKRTTSNE